MQRVFFPILGIFPILGQFLSPIFKASARVWILKNWMKAGACAVLAGRSRSPRIRFFSAWFRLGSAVGVLRCNFFSTCVPHLLRCNFQAVARALVSCFSLSPADFRGDPAAAKTNAEGGTGRKNRLPARVSGGISPRTSTPNRGIHLFPKFGIFPKWEKCSVTSAKVGYLMYSIFLGITN